MPVSFPKVPSRLLGAAVLVLALAACGGGSGGSTDSGGDGGGVDTADAGQVGVLFTDAPTDDYEHVYVSFDRIVLVPADESDAPVTIYEGQTRLDLLALSTVSDLFTVNDAVPADRYGQIRLENASVELVEKEGDTIAARVPSDRLKLNPRGGFEVAGGETVLLELDVDAEKSIQVIEAGASGQVLFRPVAFVRIIDGRRPEGRLVRVFGRVASVSAEGFVLCPQAVPAVADDASDDSLTDRGCVDVAAASYPETGWFDDAGDPTDLGALTEGQQLTAIGFIRREDDEADDTVAALDHNNGQGNDRRPGGDDENNGEDDDENDDRGGDARDDDLFDDDYRLEARVVELGGRDTYTRLDGTVAEAPSGDRMGFDVAAGQTVTASGNPFPVRLDQGTKVFSRNGTPRDRSALTVGQAAVVDTVVGVDAGGGTLLKSPLVVLMDSAAERISGTVQSADASRLTVADGTSSVLVELSGDTRCLSLEDDGSEGIDCAAIEPGDTVEVYGEASTDRLVADTVLVLDED